MISGAHNFRLPFFFTIILLLLVAKVALPVHAKDAVIFDIDGTLTYDTIDLLLARTGAQEAIQTYLDLGYEVALITARATILEPPTIFYLRLWGFPWRDVFTSFSPCILTQDQETIDYKVKAIQDFQTNLGLDFKYGYGDSTTDFAAFSQTGMDKSKVFALRRICTQEECLPGNWTECLDDYEDHLAYIRAQPPANS